MKPKITLTILASIILLVSLVNLASALTITSVSSNPAEIQPGEKVSLDLTIENNLDKDVTDVVVSLDLTNVPFAPYQSSSEGRIGDLDEDDEETIKFDLIADSNAELGSYKIPVKISYNNGSEIQNEKGMISLIISASPKLEVSAEEGAFIKGSNVVLGINIVNSGFGGAKFLSVKLNEGLGFKIIGSNSVYIGNIDSDDFDTAEFNIFINENAGILNVPLEISYTDARNNAKIETKQLTIRTYSEKEAVKAGLIKKSNRTSVIIGIIVLIVLYIIYRRIKKARKKKRLEKEA